MTDLGGIVDSAVALGVAYALTGVAVAVVVAATRSLFLAVGSLATAGLTVALTLGATSVTGVPGPVAFAAALVAAGVVGALLGPLVLARRDEQGWLVGFVVAAGALEAVVARTIGSRTLRPDALLAVGDASPVLVAVMVGLPVALVLAGVVTHTRWGHAVRIAGSSPLAAERAGLRVLVLRSTAMAVAGMAAVLAAALAAPVVALGPAQSAGLTVRAVAAAVILGRASPGWAVLTGFGIGAVEAVGQRWWPEAGGELAVAALVLGVLAVRGADAARSWGRAW